MLTLASCPNNVMREEDRNILELLEGQLELHQLLLRKQLGLYIVYVFILK